MGNIVTVEANAILTSSVTGSSYTAAHTPVNLALTTTNGDATTKGTEVVNAGGSTYARVTTASSWGSASGGTITNSALAISFLNMPACSIVGIELWDSATRTNGSADGNTTSGSPNISSVTAAFTAADVGQSITGTNIPGGTTILTYTDSTHVVLSANASGTATTTTFTIATPVRRWFGTLSASKTVNLGDTVTFATSSISITLS